MKRPPISGPPCPRLPMHSWTTCSVAGPRATLRTGCGCCSARRTTTRAAGDSPRLTREDRTVTWSHFGWADDLGTPLTVLSETQRFVFDHHQYEDQLVALRREFTDLS